VEFVEQMLFAVAREAGARQVVLVEINSIRLELAKSMGFKVIRPTTKHVKDIILADTDMEGADVTLEVAGHTSTAALMTDITKVRGTILQGSVFNQPPPIQLQHITFKEQSMVGSRVYQSKDYRTAIKLLNNKRDDVHSSRRFFRSGSPSKMGSMR
jgi:threonine dehydrogenase-like Zn-dependent dehydrogenase